MCDHWDKRFLSLAEHISNWSKDPSTKVGAVIVDPLSRVVSTGYNGFPRGIADDDRLNDRSYKYPMVVHAEVNAILFAATDLTNCTLYTVPLPPCTNCTGMIIQSGIQRVVSFNNIPERWSEISDLSIDMFREAGVDVDILNSNMEKQITICPD